MGKLWANFNQVGETAHRAGPQAIDFIGFIGGPDRDRTDDLFHAMERPKGRFIDGKGLTSRLSRQDRPNRLPMLPICYQILTERTRAEPVGEQPKKPSSIAPPAIVQQAVAQLADDTRSPISGADQTRSRSKQSSQSERAGKYECRPRAAFDYPGHISTERQGFTRVYENSVALFEIKGG